MTHRCWNPFCNGKRMLLTQKVVGACVYIKCSRCGAEMQWPKSSAPAPRKQTSIQFLLDEQGHSTHRWHRDRKMWVPIRRVRNA